MQRISRRAALAGLLGAGLAACSGKPTATPSSTPGATGSETPVGTPSATPSSTPAPVDTRPRWPLTGQLLIDPGKSRHAAVAVKVPDNQVEHPQRGIDQADIVFVELEGYRDPSGYSGTRLVPVFHTRMPDVVEPVRSIRPVDIALLSPMDAIIGNTGGSPWVLAYVQHYRAHLEGMLSYQNVRGSGSYGTDWSRVYYQNGRQYYDRGTTCHPKVLAQHTTRFRGGPPQPYFPWANRYLPASTSTGKPGRSVKIPYKGQDYFMSYRYDAGSGTYLRSMPWGPHVMADGTRIRVQNVLIIKARQHYGKIYPGRGGAEPLHDTIDTSGDFYYFNGGKYVTGTWHKGAVATPFTFTLADGSTFAMAAGKTFVELPDTGAKIRINV